MAALVHHAMTNYQPDRLPLATLAHHLGRTLRLWLTRVQERRAFPVLDDRDLRDMRLTRWDLEHELSKPFWRG